LAIFADSSIAKCKPLDARNVWDTIDQFKVVIKGMHLELSLAIDEDFAGVEALNKRK
jgi:hypothetical protein